MLDLITNASNYNWLIFTAGFFGIIAFLAIMRRVETNRITQKFKQEDIYMMSFGVNYFGLESDPGKVINSSGAMVLAKEGLYYRARYSSRELFIPGGTITNIEVDNTHKGKDLHQYALAIVFINNNGKVDRAAFRVPHPNKWTTAIKEIFIQKSK
jgi:hypothetical protein